MVDIITSAFVIIRKASITFYVYDRVNYCTCIEHLLASASYVRIHNIYQSTLVCMLCFIVLYTQYIKLRKCYNNDFYP